MDWTPAKAIECFHIAFLAALRTRLAPSRYVLKGGVNLRFFYGSPRYSEDLDLDLTPDGPQSVERQTDAALKLTAPILSVLGITVATATITKPKQTNTTRRWKVPLGVPGIAEPVRTKIEFSGRDGDHRYQMESVPRKVAGVYGLVQPLLQRYLPPAAARQKVLALAYRNETQARDVFDLDLLFRRFEWLRGDVNATERDAAANAAAALTYSTFKDQVLPFLDPDMAVLYDEYAWDNMQTGVIEELLGEPA
jgi:hypothetical protein